MESLKLLPSGIKDLELVKLTENDKYIFHRQKPKQVLNSKVQNSRTLFNYHEDDCCDSTDEYYQELYKDYGYCD